ncbi:unnamed protein product [Meloidogyne enterolobii]|uniref:Uncharacterized protein n=1 Tax=Meloidogyne enterolobii TaxID=390850 RepID=A0ACB0XUK0_MELEN
MVRNNFSSIDVDNTPNLWDGSVRDRGLPRKACQRSLAGLDFLQLPPTSVFFLGLPL